MAEGDATTRFGEELRWRRERARYSQLGLAAAAEVSQRHLSFLETGRSRPSRQMVLDLAGALELAAHDTGVALPPARAKVHVLRVASLRLTAATAQAAVGSSFDATVAFLGEGGEHLGL